MKALYQMLDLLIVPVTDNHIRAIADSWDFRSHNTETMKIRLEAFAEMLFSSKEGD